MNKRIIDDVSFEDVKSVNVTGFETILKLHKQLMGKIEGNFEDLDKPVSQGFDMSKLDALKEKSSKAFFDDMNKIKTGKGTINKNQGSDLLNDDIFGLGMPEKQVAKQEKKPDILDLNNDFMGLNMGEKPKQTGGVKNDLLDLDFLKKVELSQPVAYSIKGEAKQSDFCDFDLMGMTPQNQKSVLNNQDGMISFTNAPKMGSQTQLEFSTADLILGTERIQQEAPKKQNSDPFNFIVF